MLNGPDSNHGGCRCGAKHDKIVVHVILLQTYRRDKATANTDIIALNFKKLNVAAATLAKALCTLLAHIAKAHARHNRTDNLIASVATPLGCNQRRSIIPATQSERAPDQ